MVKVDSIGHQLLLGLWLGGQQRRRPLDSAPNICWARARCLAVGFMESRYISPCSWRNETNGFVEGMKNYIQ